jgi:nicotinate-nucleotide pyrophosphorylase (carboxylating)
LAKSDLVVAGLAVFERVMHRVDGEIRVTATAHDGEHVGAGRELALLEGGARSLLRGERPALNFLCHLSGVATLTARFVAAAGKGGPRICDTRKTTPGFRELEKYAVRMGGGFNHRFNLGAAAMIKDNHIAAVGSISEAVRRVRASLPHTATVQVEVGTLADVDEALAAGVSLLLLDNMDIDTLREAVGRCRGRALTEASGRVTLERIRDLSAVGVDVISSGALTHSAPTADISLDFSMELEDDSASAG